MQTDPKILLAFSQIDVLKNLSPAAQNILAAFSALRPIRKGETLFCQGEPSPYCFGILSGQITLVASPPQVYDAGCFLGGRSLLQEMPRPGLASVSQDGELLSVWSSRFRSWKTESKEKAAVVQEISAVLKASSS